MLNRRLTLIAAVVVAFAVVGVVAVSVVGFGSPPRSEPERSEPVQMVDSGSWYRKFRWPHDGHPYETEHFVVYSDGASLRARERLATLAEGALVDVVDEMGVDPATMFRFPAGQDKIDIYASRYHAIELEGTRYGAMAYYAGIIIPSFDSEVGRRTHLWAVRGDLKHEMVHVVEALLKGNFTGDIPVGDPRRMPVWFSEGAAQALGGFTVAPPRTLDEVDALIAKYGRINPIAWQVDLPPSEQGDSYPNAYYPMAHLAVDYLLDRDGLGRSPHDLAAVMRDMGAGTSFASAFKAHLGLSESEYEAQFWTRIDAYLPQSEFPITTVGLAVGSLLAAILMGLSLIWGFRHWPAVATTSGATGEPACGRRGRRGFAVEIAVLAACSVGFAALLLHQIAFAELPSSAQRAPGYLTTAAYLIVAAAILLWSVRRRAYRRPAAALIPLLLIADAALTVLIIGELF